MRTLISRVTLALQRQVRSHAVRMATVMEPQKTRVLTLACSTARHGRGGHFQGLSSLGLGVPDSLFSLQYTSNIHILSPEQTVAQLLESDR